MADAWRSAPNMLAYLLDNATMIDFADCPVLRVPHVVRTPHLRLVDEYEDYAPSPF